MLPRVLSDIFHPPQTPGVLAVFGHLDATVDAIGRLKANGGVPRIGGNMIIKIEMMKIWKEGSQCQI